MQGADFNRQVLSQFHGSLYGIRCDQDLVQLKSDRESRIRAIGYYRAYMEQAEAEIKDIDVQIDLKEKEKKLILKDCAKATELQNYFQQELNICIEGDDEVIFKGKETPATTPVTQEPGVRNYCKSFFSES